MEFKVNSPLQKKQEPTLCSQCQRARTHEKNKNIPALKITPLKLNFINNLFFSFPSLQSLKSDIKKIFRPYGIIMTIKWYLQHNDVMQAQNFSLTPSYPEQRPAIHLDPRCNISNAILPFSKIGRTHKVHAVKCS